MNRLQDRKNAHYFRSQRLFAVNDQWYFSTREQREQGPYPTRGEAERDMRAYVRFFKKHQKPAS